MTGLLKAELLRLTSRRLARFLVLAVLGLLLLIQLIMAVKSSPLTDAERARAAARQEQAVRFCEEEKAAGQRSPFTDCRSEADFGDTSGRLVYDGSDAVPAVAQSVTVFAALVAFIIGASYVGADWQTGAMQALLFWEPRRGRVLFAKAVALVAVLTAATVALQAAGWVTTMLVASARGTTEGLTGGVQMSALLAMVRGLFVVSFAGLLGFAITGLARATGAALAAAFGYLLVFEIILRGVRPKIVPYLIFENATAVMTKSSQGVFTEAIGGVRGAVTLTLYLVLGIGAFYATFTQRDIT